MTGLSERERIARIIDGEAFDRLTRWGQEPSFNIEATHIALNIEAVNRAFAKADLILAPHQGEEGLGVRTSQPRSVSNDRLQAPHSDGKEKP